MSSENNDERNKRRYLVNGTPFGSYHELTTLIGKMNWNAQAREGKPPITTEDPQLPTFPPELVHAIASYFTVQKMDPTKTRAIGCSSSSDQYELKECLNDTDSTWWISEIGSFRQGKGVEYVEFQLDATKIVRLSTIFISIPMLPYGPLSVRTMRLDGKTTDPNPCIQNENDGWHAVGWAPITPTLMVENQKGFQRIDLDKPIDAQYIRLVCLTNQASLLMDRLYLERAAAVGFYTVKFE